MENLEDLKTILEIVVIILGFAENFPLLAIAAGLGTIYYLLKGKGKKDDSSQEGLEL
jgi:hypothetical protein